MPRIIHRILRFKLIDRCLRDVSMMYRIGDIWERCNDAMLENYGLSISKRSIQYDISALRNAPFLIELDEELLRQGFYRYKDVMCPYVLLCDEEIDLNKASTEGEQVCLLRFRPRAGKVIETLARTLGPDVEVLSPQWLRLRITENNLLNARKYRKLCDIY